ncbi:MAG: site-2 protease family protein [Patescibacteria group bacterium]|nr:site-2 protease family protein [Patescibacteria group bacterium]
MFVVTLLILGTIIALHEYGHYVMLRRQNLWVDSFNIGFGPVLYEKKMRSGTMFNIRLIPLGGYVARKVVSHRFTLNPTWRDYIRMYLFDPPDMVPTATLGKKLQVYLAGPAMNVVLAFVTLLLMNLIFGRHSPAAVFMLPEAWGLHFVAEAFIGATIGAFVVVMLAPLLLPYIFIVSVLNIFGLGIDMMETLGLGAQQGGTLAPGTNVGLVILQDLMWQFAAFNILFGGLNVIPAAALDGGQAAMAIIRKRTRGRLRKTLKFICFRVGSIAALIMFLYLMLAGNIPRIF